MKNIDSANHTRGESIFMDDMPVREGTCRMAVFDSPAAHGRVVELRTEAARRVPGVIAILTARDIPGENQIGSIFPDEPLLAEDEVHYRGQPVALLIAETETIARAAVKKIQIEIEDKEVVVDPREARGHNLLIQPPRTFALGDTERAWQECAHIFEGVAESGGQEHLYLETQGAYAYRTESGGLRIYSSTQGPTAVQRAVARVLDLAMHKIEVDVTRLGGGFGGKEDQATPWAVMAALAAFVLRRPAKLVLHRLDDLRLTGKRHPYSSDFKIGLDPDFKIRAFEVSYHQNAGASADLSPAILERTLFHCTNSYFIPNVRATAFSCRTNLPPNTAFRGFGGPQAMFVMEAAIARAAEALGVPASLIQKKNLLRESDTFPYGQKARQCNALSCWNRLEERCRIHELREQVTAFNGAHKLSRKGLAVMPICFGISFTKTALNQASALVHIYADGSVGVSTAAVEMGQGVNTKMVQVAARSLAVRARRIKIETTNTTRVANTPPTAASAAADLNGKALGKACLALNERLRGVAARELGLTHGPDISIRDEWVYNGEQRTGLGWEQLVQAAFLERVSLSEQAHYATPGVYFDPVTEKGEPFAYHVYGSAAFVATLDCLRGTYTIDSVHVVHDYGKSMNPIIDRGQTEGGLVQGIGWVTLEEVIYNEKGLLLSNSLSTYKVPDLYAVPALVDIHFLETEGSTMAIFKSKAIGEPPVMYGIGAYFAIRNAIRTATGNRDIPYSAPLTPEKVLLALHGEGARTGSREQDKEIQPT